LSPAQKRILLRLVQDIKDIKSSGEEPMKKQRVERLVQSLGEVRDHVATGRFAGRMSEVEVAAVAIRAVRERSGMTQSQFAAAFGIGLGTLQKWQRGERQPRS
jgi:putative transcriptional regulator